MTAGGPTPRQQIRFCTSADGPRIAYAAVGQGPPLVKAANWLSHLEFDWNSPVWRHWLRELSRDHTLVRYDERGCGLSDWDPKEFSLEAWVRDLEAVVDALGLERFPLLGISQGGPIAIAYTVRHPERVSHLILYGSYSRGRLYRDLSTRERDERDLMLRTIEVGWGKDHPAFRQVFTTLFIPDATPEQAHWFNELQRVSATPENAANIVRAFDGLDVQDVAAQVHVPTLVLHGTGDLRVPFAEGRLLASIIPDARFVPLESRNHILLESEPAWGRFLWEVRGFLGVPTLPDSSKEPTAERQGAAVTGSRRRRLEDLFDQLMDLAPSAREQALARTCADDPELRLEVESLLRMAEASGVTNRLSRIVVNAAERGALPEVEPGRTLSHYDILQKVGGGGMGVVYKARDRRLHRLVALKFLPGYASAEPGLKSRFLQEAKAVASLDHPNLCTILEVEEVEDGQLFIVMPFYEGDTLKQRIGRGPIPAAEAVDYATQIAAGLAHLHAAGVVHRDIKPANIVVTTGGRVKILDFGIAKVSDMSLTRTGAVLGTLAYMSPEQASGEPVDHRTDLWALGVILHEMLTGRPAFGADSHQALFYALHFQPPAALASIREEAGIAVEQIVSRLLEKDPAKRYPDAPAVAAALDEARRLSHGLRS